MNTRLMMTLGGLAASISLVLSTHPVTVRAQVSFPTDPGPGGPGGPGQWWAEAGEKAANGAVTGGVSALVATALIGTPTAAAAGAAGALGGAAGNVLYYAGETGYHALTDSWQNQPAYTSESDDSTGDHAGDTSAVGDAVDDQAYSDEGSRTDSSSGDFSGDESSSGDVSGEAEESGGPDILKRMISMRGGDPTRLD